VAPLQGGRRYVMFAFSYVLLVARVERRDCCSGVRAATLCVVPTPRCLAQESMPTARCAARRLTPCAARREGGAAEVLAERDGRASSEPCRRCGGDEVEFGVGFLHRELVQAVAIGRASGGSGAGGARRRGSTCHDQGMFQGGRRRNEVVASPPKGGVRGGPVCPSSRQGENRCRSAPIRAGRDGRHGTGGEFILALVQAGRPGSPGTTSGSSLRWNGDPLELPACV
jgi:hypothetical protein